MTNRPTRRHGTIQGITTYRRRTLGSPACRRPMRRPPVRAARPPRASGLLTRWKAPIVCFGAAFLILAAVFGLPLLASSTAAADIDVEARAAAEASRLQDQAGVRARSVALDVPALLQYPELPTGCESVALTNALLACGFDLQKTEVAESWLPKSDFDFVYSFMGDPTSPDGHSCMAPCIVQTATDYLAAHGSDRQAVDLTGASFGDVLDVVAEGNPVVVWCTIGLEEPGTCYRSERADGRTYCLVTNSHCVVVRGYDLDAGVVLASDSLAGQVAYPLDTFAARYYALGAQAVVIR